MLITSPGSCHLQIPDHSHLWLIVVCFLLAATVVLMVVVVMGI